MHQLFVRGSVGDSRAKEQGNSFLIVSVVRGDYSIQIQLRRSPRVYGDSRAFTETAPGCKDCNPQRACK